MLEFVLDPEEDTALNLQNHGWWGVGQGTFPVKKTAPSLGHGKSWSTWQPFYPKFSYWSLGREKHIPKKAPTPTCLVSYKLVIGIPIYLMPKSIQNITWDSLSHPHHPPSPATGIPSPLPPPPLHSHYLSLSSRSVTPHLHYEVAS